MMLIEKRTPNVYRLNVQVIEGLMVRWYPGMSNSESQLPNIAKPPNIVKPTLTPYIRGEESDYSDRHNRHLGVLIHVLGSVNHQLVHHSDYIQHHNTQHTTP